MPTKKRAAEDAEESSPPCSPVIANKRARTAGGRDESTQSRGRKKGKAKATDAERNDDDDDVEHEELNVQRETSEERAEKDKQFEAAHYDKIMESVKSREKYLGVSTVD
jgi:hypothetical protein